MNYLKTV